MISWMCMTYDRKELLPGVVRMSLEKDYKGAKEFVIINDNPDINFLCDHPEVKIHNLDKRFNNIRTKYNAGVSLCSGEIYYAVADDDLYAPWSISTMEKGMRDSYGYKDFLAINGFWKQTHPHEPVWIQETVGDIFICKVDFFWEMGGYDEWSQKPVRSSVTRKVTNVAPANFIPRVKQTPHYEELVLDKENGFFTWVRGADHTMWLEDDPKKYIVKERNPEVIKIELGR